MPFTTPQEDLESAPSAPAAPAGGGFVAPDDEREMSLEGFGHNLAQDAKENATGLWNMAGKFVEHPVDTTVDTIKNTPEALINEGKRLGIGTLLEGHPVDALKQFGQAAYDKPLTTGMEVLPAAAGIAKGIGAASEAARGVETAADAAKVARAGAGADVAEQAARVGAERGAPAIAPEMGAEAGAEAEDIARQAGQAAQPSGIVDPVMKQASELKDYIGNKYGQAAAKPGWSDTVADYLDRFAQNQSVKNIGGSVGQIRQMGPDKARAIGKLALDKDLTNPFVGDIGLSKKIKDMASSAGEKIGALRDEADALRNPAKNPIDVLQEVKARLDPKYMSGRGVHSGEMSAYQKALQEIEDSEATHSGLAETATKLNKYATSEKKMSQINGPYTDVANTLSEINNQHIAEVLGPQKAAEYEQALKDFGAGKTMEKMHAFKEARETGGRMGPGGGLRHVAQRFMDAVGYKYGAKVADRMASAIRKNPDIAKDLPSMFKELHTQIGDVADEMPAQFSQGGIIGETHQYLSSKYDKRR